MRCAHRGPFGQAFRPTFVEKRPSRYRRTGVGDLPHGIRERACVVEVDNGEVRRMLRRDIPDVGARHAHAEVVAELHPSRVRSMEVRQDEQVDPSEPFLDLCVAEMRRASHAHCRMRVGRRDHAGRRVIVADALVHQHLDVDDETVVGQQRGGAGGDEDRAFGIDVGAEIPQMDADAHDPVVGILRDDGVLEQGRMREHLGAATPPPIDLRGRAGSEGEELIGSGDDHVEQRPVRLLVHELRIVEVVHRVDDRAADPARGIQGIAQLIGRERLETEVHVQHVVVLRVRDEPLRRERHGGPPLPGGGADDGRVGQHAHQLRVGDGADVGVGGGDRGDADRVEFGADAVLLDVTGRWSARVTRTETLRRKGGRGKESEVYVHTMSHSRDSRAGVAPSGSAVLARQRHYAEFFGLAPLPERFGVILGNCQAESLRLVIDAAEHRFVRVPPVFEMDAAETARLHEVVATAEIVVSQPIRDDYRDLPLGTRQIAAVTSARMLTVPPVRFAGLHPFQAAIRVPGVDGDPPVVAYHDVRTLAAAAGIPVVDALSPDAVRAVGRSSIDTLREREQRADVRVSDLFDPVTTDHMRTVNHPGNAVWRALGTRVLEMLGLDGEASDHGRALLASVQAPLAPEVVEAWSLPDPPRAHWIVEGVAIDDDEVRAAHTAWYAAHPDFVEAAVERLAPLLAVWRA